MPPRKTRSGASPSSAPAAKKPKAADASTTNSIVLIGMRGAGKTHLGRAAAKALDLTFVDLDEAYEQKHGKIMETVKSEGWPVFRQREVAMLRDTLSSSPSGYVIACGGGVVETEEGRTLLREHYPVVQAVKPIDDIETYLGIDSTRPSLGEPPRVAYERRKGWYAECADLDHLAAPGETAFEASCERLVATLKRLRGVTPPAALPHEHSFFISLTYPDLAAVLPLPEALWTNTDAVELRCDLLHSLEPSAVQTQIAVLKAHCPLPIIFTIRSKTEGGAFTGTTEQYLQLNTLALRAGCEWIDLEACRNGAEMREFADGAIRMGARLLGSNHILGPMPPAAEIQACLRRCELGGKAAVAKFVGVATEPKHALHVHAAASTAGLSKPYIALAMGGPGRMSRVLNVLYTPVTHPLLPMVAAPGQMSAAQLIESRRELGYMPSRAFYIFGKPTQHSPSPSMHNAAFGANGTAHTYAVCETDEVSAVLAALRKPDAGGGSVTIPLKEQLMGHVDTLSASAKAIGSLNTLCVQPDGTISADNTDWLGIRNLLRDCLRARGVTDGVPLVGVVMGGGGTARAACYALNDLGVGSLYIANRSTDKAEALASEFGGKVLASLVEGAAALPRIDLLVSCVPGSAGLTLPVDLLKKANPIVLDAAYRPRETPLLAAAAAAGCTAVEGVEMLYEQGCAQAVIWTHRPAPRAAVAKGIAAFLASQDFGPLPARIANELVG